MSAIELENPEEHAIYNIYLELIDVWMDVMENIISKEEGIIRINSIILKMKASLKAFPHEEFMLKYFFINGEGWKNYHPLDLANASSELKRNVIGIRTGTIRFYNPDLEYLGLNIKEGTADAVLQEVLDKTKNYKNVTPEELAEDYLNIENMEKTLKEMEKSLADEKDTLTMEEEIMEELLQNDEVKKLYQKMKEDKMKNKDNKTEEEVRAENVKEETEQKVEEDIKEEVKAEEEDLSLSTKIIIGTIGVGILATVGYFLKEKFL